MDIQAIYAVTEVLQGIHSILYVPVLMFVLVGLAFKIVPK